MIRIGLDIGGTKTEIIALDASGATLLQHREPTPHSGYEESIGAISGLVLEAERALGSRCSIGIGTPGTASPRTGVLRNAYALPLNGRPIKRDLEKLLDREVRIANDANCFVLSEAVDGAAKGRGVVFGVILGTGVGGGVVVNSRLIEGANGIAGEWGHNPLPWTTANELPGPPCNCSRYGCIETYLSGPGFARDHLQVTGEMREPAEIVAAAQSGDSGCASTLERYEERLARSLASVINLLDPDIIVLGGGMSNTSRLYSNVPAYWSRYVYSDAVVTPLVPASHGDASGARGAARLW